MKNIKIESGFVGHTFWPSIAFVDVRGKANAKEFPKDGSEKEMEDVIQSWDDTAILRVTPRKSFKFGYVQGNAFHYLKEEIITKEGLFGVHLGDGNIRFFVLPTSLDCDMKLELVKITKENNPDYRDLPLY